MIDEKLKLLADDLFSYMKSKRKWDRDPTVEYKFDDGNAKRFLGKTGYYDPNSEQIVIFCTNRHPKDILRSLAHELIHHVQKCEGRMDPNEAADEHDETYVLHNQFLRRIEEEAFLEGNLDLREWEAHMKERKEDPTINENKKMQDERSLTPGEKKKKERYVLDLKKQGLKGSKLYGTATKIAKGEKVGGSKKEESVEEGASCYEEVNEGMLPVVKQEPVNTINPALKDSVVYNPSDRECNDLYSGREELVFQELLKKFGIKK